MPPIIRKAFTLIELLVVIAIIGILSGLIVVSMSGVTQKANVAKAQVFSNSLRNSLMLNIVAQYAFDDIDSTDYDTTTKVMNTDANNVPDSWSTNEGTANGGPTVKEGNDCVSGKCLSFDGTDDYIDFGGSNLNVDDLLTINFWIKDTISDDGVIGKWAWDSNAYRDWTIFANGANLLFVVSHDGTWDNWKQIRKDMSSISGSWSNLTYTFNKGDMKLYVNGQEQTVIPSTTGTVTKIYQSTGAIQAGRAYYLKRFNGLLDEIRIYNTIMTSSQIKEQYYLGLNKLLASGNISIADYQSRLLIIANK